MTSRYGNFIGGKYFLVNADWQYGSQDFTNYYRTEGGLMPELPKTDTAFDYSGIGGGVWNLSASQQFPKNINRTITTGLTPALHVTSQFHDTLTYLSNTVDISRYANRSARIAFRAVIPYGSSFSDAFIDAVNVSGTTYGFEVSGESWQTTTTNAQGTPYESLAWTTIASTRTRNRFARANTTTLIDNYYGTGTAAGIQPNGNFGLVTTNDSTYGEPIFHSQWIRSPVIALGSSPTLSYQYFNLSSYYSNYLIYTYLDLQ